MSVGLGLLLSLSLAGSLLALLVLALRPLMRRRVTRAWQYYIWLVVLARLLLPLTPAQSLMGALFMYTPPAAAALPPPAAAPRAGPRAAAPAAPEPAPDAARQPPDAGGQGEGRGRGAALAQHWWLVWGAVALALLVRKATAYGCYVRGLRAGSRQAADEALLARYAAACARAGVRAPPQLCLNPAAASPMLVGLARPFIVLPDAQAPGLEEILLHELVHHRRRDILYKWLVQTALCLHWFNPFLYFVARRIERDCELACDEAVLSLLREEGRRGYGEALLSSLRAAGPRQGVPAALQLTEDYKQMEERLDAIMDYRAKTGRMRLLGALLTVALCVGALTLGAYAQGGASQAGQGESDFSTPKAALEGSLEAAKALDMETFNAHSDNRKADKEGKYKNTPWRYYTLFGDLCRDKVSQSDRAFYEEVVERLSWSVGEVKETGGTAKAQVRITNADLTDVTGYLIADALGGAFGEADPPEKELIDYVQEAKAAGKDISLDLTVTLQKAGGQWKLHVDDDFANAVFGNMMTEDYTDPVKERVRQAEQALEEQVEAETNQAMRDLFGEDWEPDLADDVKNEIESEMEDWDSRGIPGAVGRFIGRLTGDIIGGALGWVRALGG